MRIPNYDHDEPVPIATFGRHINPPRSVACLRNWQKEGVLNRYTRQKVRCQMTRLPNGGWGVSIQQYEAFLHEINKRP